MAGIDENIHPVATGAAASTVAAHAADQPLKLYGAWFCPYVQRAWITLVEKRNVPYQFIEVNPYKKTAELLALNPRGLVPTLVVPPSPAPTGNDENTTATAAAAHPPLTRKPLYESAVVCEYLDEAYADDAAAAGPYGARLTPQIGEDDGRGGVVDAYERARVRLWVDHANSRIAPAFYRLMQHTPAADYGLDDARARLRGHIRAFAKEMLDSDDASGGESGGPWFLGRRFGMVEVMLAPWACRLFLLDHYKPGGTGIPPKGQRAGAVPPSPALAAVEKVERATEDDRVWARWHAWYDAVLERDSVKQTLSDVDRYIDVYKRYAEDETQSEVAQATRRGLPLP